MVELVDTQDLKSCDLKSRAGSIPAPSTKAEPRFGFCCLLPLLFSIKYILDFI